MAGDENVDSNRRFYARATVGSDGARGCGCSRDGDGGLVAHESMSPVVSAKLAGKNEVPKGSPAGSGLVVLHLDATKGTVCWTFAEVAKIGKATAAHIHKGGAGKAGPVVVPLGAVYKAKGCTKAPRS